MATLELRHSHAANEEEDWGGYRDNSVQDLACRVASEKYTSMAGNR